LRFWAAISTSDSPSAGGGDEIARHLGATARLFARVLPMQLTNVIASAFKDTPLEKMNNKPSKNS
jgi:hypothetical protein